MELVNGKLKKSPTGDMAEERMNTINSWLRDRFGKKMIKLSLDGGFTCPNRDGTKGTGGCLFCGAGGGADFSSNIKDQIRLLSNKWPKAGYLAYFQNHTNTYAPVSELKEKFDAVLKLTEIEGIVIGTRPDCINDEVLEFLAELNERTFMWIELGLQTANDKTAEFINRCYNLSVYDECIERLKSKNIKVVTHLILGLPGETREDMISSVKHVSSNGTWGIKLHLLNVVRGSKLAEIMPDYVPFSCIEEYVSLVCDLIEIIPDNMIIHRLTADAMRKTLVAPEWSYKKRTILNSINKELEKRGSYQGGKLK